MPRRCRRADIGLVLIKARKTACTEIRIGDRPALFSHPRLTESRVCLQQAIVLLACDHILPRRPGGGHVAVANYRRMLHHNGMPSHCRRGCNRCQAGDQKRQTSSSLDHDLCPFANPESLRQNAAYVYIRFSPGYCTARARSREYSSLEILFESFRRSSFSSSSATLKPTKWRSSSRDCSARWVCRSAIPRPCVIR